MSCVSSNFSSFFLNSLNDASEFSKYLSNGELKCSPIDEFQVLGGGTTVPQQQQQQYQQQQQQQLIGSNGNVAGTANPANVNGSANEVHSQFTLSVLNGSDVFNTATTGCGMQVEKTNYNNVARSSAQPEHTHLLLQPEQQHSHLQQQQQRHHHIHQSGQHSPAISHHMNPTQHQHPSIFNLHQHQHQHQTATVSSTGSVYHPNHLHASVASMGSTILQHPYCHAHTQTLAHTHTSNANNNLPALQGGSYSPATQRWPTAMSLSASGVPHMQHHNHQHQHQQQHQHQHQSPQTTTAHFDGSFEFAKYLRHSNESNVDLLSSSSSSSNVIDSTDMSGNGGGVGAGGGGGGSNSGASGGAGSNTNNPIVATTQSHQLNTSSLIDLDSSTTNKSPRSSRQVAALLSSVSRASNSLDSTALDVMDHDSKNTIFELQHLTNSSNSNESSIEVSNATFPNSYLNASNSNTSSEGATAGSIDFPLLNSMNVSVSKPLANFTINENFDVYPSHKVEEGIFQHMNKLPSKKKENLKQLGVRFTGQMTLGDKSIIVDNFTKFCLEYNVSDHRPFLCLNQSGLNKPEQIKFARYLGQGLPTFTLFCIYSNFKNLFCTKRTEIYTKDGYNLPYILDKTKRFLSNTTPSSNTPNKHVPNASIPPPLTATKPTHQLAMSPTIAGTQPMSFGILN